MAIYYINRAFEILQKEGVRELLNSSIRFIMGTPPFSSFILFYQTVRLDLTTKEVKEPLTSSVVRKYLKFRHTYIDELSYLYVNPHDIKYMLCESDFVSYKYKNRLPRSWNHEPEKGSFHPQLYTGLIIGGDWDKYRRLHKYDRVYRGLKQHYKQGTNWEATAWGRMYINEEYRRNRKNRLNEKINETEILYNSIKNKGLLRPDEINEKENKPLKRPFGLTVNIGREGEIIFNNLDGHRRLAIAKILDLEKIPVWVVVRHKQWQKIRNEVNKNGLSEEHEKLRDHPDLKDII